MTPPASRGGSTSSPASDPATANITGRCSSAHRLRCHRSSPHSAAVNPSPSAAAHPAAAGPSKTPSSTSGATHSPTADAKRCTASGKYTSDAASSAIASHVPVSSKASTHSTHSKPCPASDRHSAI
ncbi:MAG: hypothetical protein R3F65_01825 [bacterium]